MKGRDPYAAEDQQNHERGVIRREANGAPEQRGERGSRNEQIPPSHPVRPVPVQRLGKGGGDGDSGNQKASQSIRDAKFVHQARKKGGQEPAVGIHYCMPQRKDSDPLAVPDAVGLGRGHIDVVRKGHIERSFVEGFGER